MGLGHFRNWQPWALSVFSWLSYAWWHYCPLLLQDVPGQPPVFSEWPVSWHLSQLFLDIHFSNVQRYRKSDTRLPWGRVLWDCQGKLWPSVQFGRKRSSQRIWKEKNSDHISTPPKWTFWQLISRWILLNRPKPNGGDRNCEESVATWTESSGQIVT